MEKTEARHWRCFRCAATVRRCRAGFVLRRRGRVGVRDGCHPRHEPVDVLTRRRSDPRPDGDRAPSLGGRTHRLTARGVRRRRASGVVRAGGRLAGGVGNHRGHVA